MWRAERIGTPKPCPVLLHLPRHCPTNPAPPAAPSPLAPPQRLPVCIHVWVNHPRSGSWQDSFQPGCPGTSRGCRPWGPAQPWRVGDTAQHGSLQVGKDAEETRKHPGDGSWPDPGGGSTRLLTGARAALGDNTAAASGNHPQTWCPPQPLPLTFLPALPRTNTSHELSCSAAGPFSWVLAVEGQAQPAFLSTPARSSQGRPVQAPLKASPNRTRAQAVPGARVCPGRLFASSSVISRLCLAAKQTLGENLFADKFRKFKDSP